MQSNLTTVLRLQSDAENLSPNFVTVNPNMNIVSLDYVKNAKIVSSELSNHYQPKYVTNLDTLQTEISMNPQSFHNAIKLLNAQKKAMTDLKKHELKYRLHPDDALDYEYIQNLANEINNHFHLYHEAIIINPIQTELLWGLCEYQHGIVHLLFRWPGEDYTIERRTLIRVLCHELAHFKHQNHEKEFFEFCDELIDYARELTKDTKIKRERFIPKDCASYGF